MQNTTSNSARRSKAKFESRILCKYSKINFNFILGGRIILVLLILLLVAVITDLSVIRIPNLLIVIGLIGGIFYRVLCLGERNYWLILAGVAIPVILFFPLFMIRAMGAGDIKLLAVTGTFFTIGENIKCIVLAILLGGVIAIFKILFKRNIRERIKYLFNYLGNVFRYAVAGSFYGLPYTDKEDGNEVKNAGIRFSLPILLSAIIVMGEKV